jgi:hypothetical protein
MTSSQTNAFLAFVNKISLKVTIPDGKLEEIQSKSNPSVYYDFIADHERTMVTQGLRIKEDLYGLTDLDAVFTKSLAPRPPIDNMKLMMAPYQVVSPDNQRPMPFICVTYDRGQYDELESKQFTSVPFFSFPVGHIPEGFIDGNVFDGDSAMKYKLFKEHSTVTLSDTAVFVRGEPNDNGWWSNACLTFKTVRDFFHFIEEGTSQLLPIKDWNSQGAKGASYTTALKTYCQLKYGVSTLKLTENAKWKGYSVFTRGDEVKDGEVVLRYYEVIVGSKNKWELCFNKIINSNV